MKQPLDGKVRFIQKHVQKRNFSKLKNSLCDVAIPCISGWNGTSSFTILSRHLLTAVVL